MEDRSDVGVRIVRRKVKLNSNPLPLCVGMRLDAIPRNVSRQDWDWKHSDFGEVRPEPVFECRRELAPKGILDGLGTEAGPDHLPDWLLFFGQMRDVFRKQVDLNARRPTVAVLIFAST